MLMVEQLGKNVNADIRKTEANIVTVIQKGSALTFSIVNLMVMRMSN